VQSKGRRVHAPHFILILMPRADSSSRLGITVTKKVGSAVGRNRIKRLVREVFRQNRSLFPQGADVVVVAKRGATQLDYAQVLSELSQARGAMRGALRRLERTERGEGQAR